MHDYQQSQFRVRSLFYWRNIQYLWIPSIFLIIVGLVCKRLDIPMYDIVADPAEICVRPLYIGFLSQLGLFLWCIGAASCFFFYSLVNTPLQQSHRRELKFLLWSGMATVLLFLDDWLQIHETLPRAIFRQYLESEILQIPLGDILELVFFSLYFLFFAWYLFRFRSIIYDTQYLYLIHTVLFFIISTIVDIAVAETVSWHFTVEEYTKFLGIISWATYLWITSREFFTQSRPSLKSLPSQDAT